jgi:site-specific DNA-methyltransferase (adenine-specific)/adenine-specific DNA-methyltransferase
VPTLNWIGKEAVVRHHKEVPFRLLEPVPDLCCPLVPPGEAQATEADGNLIVQGDNLHALKALLPRYAGQVKCIYIDPPYNTGNEGWVYNDNVNSPEIRRWLGEVVGKEGETLDRHDRWLCMMYPRLVLLRQFLREDGVIFVNIGTDAFANLGLLMDEIFGVANRIAIAAWETAYTANQTAKHISETTDFLYIYGKRSDLAAIGKRKPERKPGTSGNRSQTTKPHPNISRRYAGLRRYPAGP